MSVSLQQGLKRLVFVLVVIFLSIYTLIWLLSPWVANHYLGRFVDGQGLELSEKTRIRYNPFLSSVEVNDLALFQTDGKSVFAVTDMRIELHLHQLFFKEIYIAEAWISGLNIRAEHTEQQWLIAGISSPKTSATESSAAQSDPDRRSATSTAFEFPYEVIMPAFVLADSNIDIYDNDGMHQFKISELTINQLFATAQQQSFQLSVNSQLNQAAIDLQIEGRMDEGEGALDIALNLVELNVEKFRYLLPSGIDLQSGLVSYQGQQHLDIKKEAITVSVNEGVLSTKNMDIVKKEAHVFIGKQTLTIDKALVLMEKNTAEASANALSNQVNSEPKVTAEVSLTFENVTAYNKEQHKILADIKALTLQDVYVSSNQQKEKNITIGELHIAESSFSDDHQNPLPALLAFTSLNINNIDLSQHGIELGEVTLAGLVANAELDEKKQLTNLLELPVLTAKPDTTNDAERLLDEEQATLENENEKLIANSNDPQNKKRIDRAFNIKLASFKLASDAHINLLDRSVKPAYQMKVALQSLSAGPFDTENPAQESIITLAGDGNRYAKFSFVTKAKPFLNEPRYDIKGTLAELSLPELSSYIKQTLGYEIESGQLDLDINVDMLGTVVDGDVDVLLRGIELTAADDYEVSSLNDQISVPFNIALGMLKDGNGNVDISLPITGDTRNPNFGISGLVTLLVKKATIMGAQDYLVTTFVPYANVVNIAVLAGKYVLKVRINDLPYTAEEVELQPEQDAFLAQFAALLKDHQDTQVKLCAIATVDDIDKDLSDDVISEEDIQRMREISVQRVSIFKEYMIEKENIKSSRLLLCTPQIDSSEGAVSRLSFKI